MDFLYFWKMKIYPILTALVITFAACKSQDAKENTIPSSEPSAVASPPDSIRPMKKDSNPSVPIVEATPTQEKPLVPAPTKVCDPAYTKLFAPKADQYIYYVSGFNPDEFKCWVELENQGTKICGDRACIVYFVDSPKVKATKTPPHFLDDATLKQNGIGKFVFDGKYWEIKGAGQWKRQGNGYGYYNTNNQFGG